MIIDLHTQKFCMYVSSMNLFAYSIASATYDEFIGVNFTIFDFQNLKLPYLRESSAHTFRGFWVPKTGCTLESMAH